MTVPVREGRESLPDPKMRKWRLWRHRAPPLARRLGRNRRPDRAERPAETVRILHDVIQACGRVRIGRMGWAAGFEGAGVSESGGGKGGLEGAGVATPRGRSEDTCHLSESGAEKWCVSPVPLYPLA